jgi:hypothetical protein
MLSETTARDNYKLAVKSCARRWCCEEVKSSVNFRRAATGLLHVAREMNITILARPSPAQYQNIYEFGDDNT